MSAIDNKVIRLCNKLDVKDAVIGLLDDSLKERDERVAILRTIVKDNDTTIDTLRKLVTVYVAKLNGANATIDKLRMKLYK